MTDKKKESPFFGGRLGLQ